MNIYSGIWKRLLFRLLFGAPLLVIGAVVMVRGGGGGSMAGAFVTCLFGAALIILGAILLAPPLAELVANTAMKGFFSLIFPDRRFERPQPNYSIPEARVKAGQYGEAMALYEKLAAEYPGEVRVYVEMVDLAAVRLHDSARAEAILRRGLAAVQDPEGRKALERSGRAILSRLDPDPEWRHRRKLQPPPPAPPPPSPRAAKRR